MVRRSDRSRNALNFLGRVDEADEAATAAAELESDDGRALQLFATMLIVRTIGRAS